MSALSSGVDTVLLVSHPKIIIIEHSQLVYIKHALLALEKLSCEKLDSDDCGGKFTSFWYPVERFDEAVLSTNVCRLSA